jgi:hypothetical protein
LGWDWQDVYSVGITADEQREDQENMLRRFEPSPVSALLKRAMEQGPQPEIALVPSDSGSASLKVSSEDSDSEMQLSDPDENGVIITGGGRSCLLDAAPSGSRITVSKTHTRRRRPDWVSI